jgi:folate-binding protein YgfZ
LTQLAAPTAPAAQAEAVRRAAGWFRLRDRGLIEVSGGDRVRWLDGMVSNDVARLRPGCERSGCYAAVLTSKGRIVADLHVLLRDRVFWLETSAAALPAVIEYLERHLIADDVSLSDISGTVDRLALEGPLAQRILEKTSESFRALEADAWAEAHIGDATVAVARYGWSGEDGFQLLIPVGSGGAVTRSLEAAGAGLGLVCASQQALEILRIEAGIPAFGAELDETVLPAEARLDRAISRSKACYVGQEVVARMATAGRVSHALVGLALEDGPIPEPGTAVIAGTAKVGEITSSCRSPLAGPIALAFVRSAHADAGTALSAAGRPVRVARLPFAGPGAQVP